MHQHIPLSNHLGRSSSCDRLPLSIQHSKRTWKAAWDRSRAHFLSALMSACWAVWAGWAGAQSLVDSSQSAAIVSASVLFLLQDKLEVLQVIIDIILPILRNYGICSPCLPALLIFPTRSAAMLFEFRQHTFIVTKRMDVMQHSLRLLSESTWKVFRPPL